MMTSATFSTSMEAQQAAVLLEGYHFELGRHDARQWVSLWLESYRANWIRDAVIEALYQGRYKSISVKQILDMWQRRGQPIRHATHDFEAAVCREFGEIRLAPIPPEYLPKSSSERKKYRSIARPHYAQNGQAQNGQAQNGHDLNGQTQNGHDLNGNAASAASLSSESNGTLPRTQHRSNRLQHKQNAAVSFNLSALPPVSPGMAARGEAVMNQGNQASAENPSAPNGHSDSTGEKPKEIRDNRDWREFPGYTTPTYSTSNPDEVLRAQKQFNGVLYSTARAIQPFKPALPFSAQTLRLARQKAIALMNQAQQEAQQEGLSPQGLSQKSLSQQGLSPNSSPEHHMAELPR